MNLFNWLNKQRRWSAETFGTGKRTKGILSHIEKEIAEIRANPEDLSEYVDVLILTFDLAWRQGFTPAQICNELERKQNENMSREWDVKGEDEPCEHIRCGVDLK